MEVSNQCRLCLKKDNAAISVFDETEKKLWDKIYVCFGVQIKHSDPITKNICRCCYYFTNSAYEHRIASQENDLILKKEYEETTLKSIEKHITQNDFLNNLKLTNVHTSITTLKRKYPNINIPECCNNLDIDPFIDVLSPPKRKAIDFHSHEIKTENNERRSSTSSNGSSIKTRFGNNRPQSEPLRRFPCNNCHKKFVNKRFYRNHKCSVICPDCGKSFRNSFYYDKHKISHMTTTIEPNEIQVETKSEVNLQTRIEPNEIEFETKSEANETHDETHDETHGSNLLVEGEEVNAFICLTCNKIFDAMDELKYHKRSAHKLSLRCDKCPKKFMVVEALMKHQKVHAKRIVSKAPQETNTSCEQERPPEPQEVLQEETNEASNDSSSCEDTLFIDVENTQIEDNFEIQSEVRGKMIARKHTDGALYLNNSKSSSSSDSDSSLSSSDDDEDDCKITEVSTEKKDYPLETALVPQSDNKDPIKLETKTYKDVTSILIIDSDSENEETKKPNQPVSTEILSSGDDEANGRNSPIIISANTEECPTGASITKVTNEINYINYLYNKCSNEVENKLINGDLWNLQNITQLAKNIIVPIEINRVLEPNVTMKYTTTSRKKNPAVPQIPWNYTKAIDLNIGVNNKTSKSKQLNTQLALARNQKASIKVPIPSAAVKAKLINGQKTNQFMTKYVPTNTEPTKKKIQKKQQSQENIPNNNCNQRSILKNVLTTSISTTTTTTTTTSTSPQPFVYTYMPTTPIITNQNYVTTTPQTDHFMMPYHHQPVQTLNKNTTPTILFQQFDQHHPANFINIAQPTFYAAAPDNNTAPLYLKQPDNLVIQPAEILPHQQQQEQQLVQQTPEQEQMNEVTSSSLHQNDGNVHRPMIRIKSLSELTAKTPEQSKDELNSYLNVYANYVSTRR